MSKSEIFLAGFGPHHLLFWSLSIVSELYPLSPFAPRKQRCLRKKQDVNASGHERGLSLCGIRIRTTRFFRGAKGDNRHFLLQSLRFVYRKDRFGNLSDFGQEVELFLGGTSRLAGWHWRLASASLGMRTGNPPRRFVLPVYRSLNNTSALARRQCYPSLAHPSRTASSPSVAGH
jgi:hypothetical protein